MQRVRCYLLFAGLTMFTRFDANKSTKGASKLRRDLINAEIANLRDLLPLPASTRQRLSQLQLMALVCVYVRKTNYFQQAFKNHNATLSAATPSIGFSKALNGFLMMMTQNGKLLYISDNATEYLGHSMEDLLIHGDSVYDIIDKQDHGVIQAEMSRSSTSDEREEPRMFMCRINVTRNARRQMRFGDQKVVLVRGHYLSFLPLCSRNEPVFIATCTPVAMPETRECVVQGATNVFTSIHSMDMKFMYLDRIGEYHLGYIWVELQGVSWYKLLHWECMQEAQAKHRLITQSDQDRACILLVRLQKRAGDWVWIHCVLQVKDNIENNQHPVIVCTNQILTEREAIVMRSNSWLYEYYMVQSKLQYGLTYGGHSTASRTTPFYHHHSPQSVIPPIQNHLHHHGQPPDSEIASPHVQGISIVQSHIGISATDHNRIMTEPPLPGPSHHGIEKVEPVDYSVHQASPHQHLYPLGHQIEGASRFFPAHTFIDDNSHIFPKLRVEETDPHLVYGHSYRPDTITHHSFSPSTDSPDTYSYQQLGSDNIDTSVYSEVPVSGYPMYVQHEVDNSVRRRKSSVQSLDGTDSDKYKLKHRKSSVESYSSDAASMLRADNENVDDVFLKQWKRRASPDPDENSWQRNKTPRISNEGRTSRLSSQQSLSNLSFQTISDTGTNQLNNNSAEHADKVTHSNLNNKQELTQNQILLKGSGSFNHWNEFSSPFQPKLYSFETTQGELCYPVTTATTKDDCICCRDQLENYNTAIYRDLVTDQYITSKIFADSKVPINAAKMYNLTSSNCQIQWPMDHLIYPLKPPPVARVDVSPMSIESPADGEHLPVSYEKQA